MNNYNLLEDRYYNSLSNNELMDKLLYEFDLSSIKDDFKEKLSKLNLTNASIVFEKINKKLSNKLKEFDVDPEAIKNSAKKSTKDIYSIIDKGLKNKIPSKITAKKIEKKVIASVSQQIKDSTLSGIQIIMSLVFAVAIMLFMMMVIIGILNIILNVNIVLAYIIVLFFIFAIYELSFSLMVKWIDGDSDSTVVSYRNKLKNIKIQKYDESANEKIYILHVFINSFKNVIQKIKK